MIQCALFDLGATLLLHTPDLAETILGLCREFASSIELTDVHRACAHAEEWIGAQASRELHTGVRMGKDEFLSGIADAYVASLGLPGDAALHAGIMRAVREEWASDWALRDGALDVLSALRDAGVRMGVVSNNSAAVVEHLQRLGIKDYFEDFVISDEVGVAKPDPRILQLACQRLGIPATDAVYIGDHPFDIVCAHAAGMPIVWCPANEFVTLPESVGKPEHTALDFRSIPTLLLGK